MLHSLKQGHDEGYFKDYGVAEAFIYISFGKALFFDWCLLMLSCTGHHVFRPQADFAVLSVGSGEPGISAQR